MNFPNLAIVRTCISRWSINTLKLSLHSKTPLFPVSCKNREKSPLHCGLRKWRSDSDSHEGHPAGPFEFRAVIVEANCVGKTCVIPKPSELGVSKCKRHSVQQSISDKGRKAHCEQPVYISFFHTSSFFPGACSGAAQTWRLIMAKIFSR